MPLVSQDVTSLTNGVSQQPAVQRLPSQAEAQVNCQSSVVDGMKRRPPTRHIAKISTDQLDSAFIHLVDRDAATKYAVVVTDGDLKVVSMLDASIKAVAFPHGKAYLTNSDPRRSFRAVTAGDFTFLVNRGAIAGMTGDKSPTPKPAAMVAIMAANYREKFQLTVAGNTFTLDLPGATADEATRTWLNTSSVASVLHILMTTGSYSGGPNGPTGSATGGSLAAMGFYVELQGSCLRITRENGEDFSITATDGAGGTHMRAFKGSTQKFTDLPKVGVDGFTIKISGDPGDEGTDYWVQYRTSFDPPATSTPNPGGNTGEPPPNYGGGWWDYPYYIP